MEMHLRAVLIDWLRTAPTLAGQINAVAEESPVSASPPWLGIAASASADWSTKDLRGCEVRIALELHTRGDDPAADGTLAAAITERIIGIPAAQECFSIVTARFLRSRSERRARNLRVALLEYTFRLLEK